MTCTLRHQIQIDLPESWEIAGVDILAEMRNAANGKIDLWKLPVKQLGEYETLLVARGDSTESFALITITFKADGAPTQAEVFKWSADQVTKWCRQSESEMKNASAMFSGFVWGSAERLINGSNTFLRTTYQRIHQSTGDPVSVSIYNYFDEHAIQITTTCPTSDQTLWKPKFDQIIRSLLVEKENPDKAKIFPKGEPEQMAIKDPEHDLVVKADAGDVSAQLMLGALYSQGSEEDDVKSARWFKMAAEQGSAPAQYALGLYFFEGKGVAKDLVESTRWLKLAAENQNADAQFEFGRRLLHGVGVPKDGSKAINCFVSAAGNGNLQALGYLGSFYYLGAGVPKDLVKAKSYLTRGADKDDALSQSMLGQMYYEGAGVPQDFVIAYMWLNLAAAKSFKMGDKETAAIRDQVGAQMTQEQIAEAQKLSRDWKPDATGK
jgi:TPR repeat protein